MEMLVPQILSPAIYDAHIRPKGTGMTNVTKGADDGESINAVVDEEGGLPAYPHPPYSHQVGI